jgi:hypothetical protein
MQQTPARSEDLERRVLASLRRLLREIACPQHREVAGERELRFEPRTGVEGPVGRVRCVVGAHAIGVRFDLPELGAGAPASAVLEALSRVTLPIQFYGGDDGAPIALQLQVDPRHPVTPIRERSIRGALEQVVGLFGALRRQVRRPMDDRLEGTLAPFSEQLRPVLAAGPASDEEMRFATRAGRLLGDRPAILWGADADDVDLALGLVAGAVANLGRTLVTLKGPAPGQLDAARLGADLLGAGGLLAVPAATLIAGVNPYDLARHTGQLLADLRHRLVPLVIFGPRGDLEGVFALQGVDADPLLPLELVAPTATAERMIVRAASRVGRELGLPPPEESRIAAAAREALATHAPGEARRLASATVGLLARSPGAGKDEAARRVRLLSDATRELGGVSGGRPLPRGARRQQRLMDVLMDEGTVARHKAKILGQDRALDALYARLRSQLLFGAGHKPLAALMEGPPAVGKSASVEYLAEALGMELLYLDVAGMGSWHQAHAMLSGSGVGIVQSYLPGKLEQACRVPTILEVADLDHASDEVRSSVSDLFMQLLDRGVTQTAAGRTIHAEDLVICFTSNLPARDDELLRRRLGVDNRPLSPAEIQERIEERLAGLFTQAFMSRVGAPVVFDPLGEDTRREVIRRALESSLRQGLETRGAPEVAVAVTTDAVELVATRQDLVPERTGARRLGALVAAALLEAMSDLTDPIEATSITVRRAGDRLTLEGSTP